MDYLPLQSHGLCKTVDVWEPPRGGRFVSCDKSDESWMRPLGIGNVVKRPNPLLPVDLYDVRDEKGDLVGYSEWNPVDYYNRGSRDLMISAIDTFPRPVQFFRPESDPYTRRDTIREIRIRISRYSVACENYLCWQVQLYDAPALILGKWIKAIGECRVRELAYEAHQRARELGRGTGAGRVADRVHHNQSRHREGRSGSD